MCVVVFVVVRGRAHWRAACSAAGCQGLNRAASEVRFHLVRGAVGIFLRGHLNALGTPCFSHARIYIDERWVLTFLANFALLEN